MYGSVLGASTVVPGAAGVALLPNTGGFRVMFVISAIALAFGVATLAVSGVGAIMRRSHKA